MNIAYDEKSHRLAWLPGVSIGLTAAAFGGFGVVLLLDPGLLATVGVEVSRPAGAVELRGFYGGLELGMAIFFAIALLRRAWWRPALLAQVLALGGAAAGRVFGILVGGGGEPLIYMLLLAEATAAVVGLLALRVAPRPPAGG